jgi:poly(3-hydroxybutyrate) depolymerase
VLYPWLDWHRAGLEAWLATARLATLASPLDQALHPSRELLGRTLAAAVAADRPVEEAVRRDAPFPVQSEVLAVTPFVRLVRLWRRNAVSRRRIVLLAPHSGYAASVVSPLLTVLVALGEVVVTDWVDGRLVPLAAGGFGLADQVAIGAEAAALWCAPAHWVALSQSGPAALATAVLLASEFSSLRPASLAFLGCQLDPRVTPTHLQQALGHWPRDLLAASLTSEVGPTHPGAGRRVYPALFQLLAYGLASPGLYSEVQQGLMREIAAGQAGAYDRQHGDLHSLLDIPGELFMDMLGWALDRSPWQSDRLVLAGAEHAVAGLDGTPVLAVEAGRDGLVGRGQTHALAKRLPSVRTLTVPGASHHDLFTGPAFLAGTAPELRRFYGALPD